MLITCVIAWVIPSILARTWALSAVIPSILAHMWALSAVIPSILAHMWALSAVIPSILARMWEFSARIARTSASTADSSAPEHDKQKGEGATSPLRDFKSEEVRWVELELRGTNHIFNNTHLRWRLDHHRHQHLRHHHLKDSKKRNEPHMSWPGARKSKRPQTMKAKKINNNVGRGTGPQAVIGRNWRRNNDDLRKNELFSWRPAHL